MKDFNFAEDVVSTEVVVTDGIGDGGIGVLAGTDLTTSSLSNAQKKYYYNLQFNSKDHFSVTYGHIDVIKKSLKIFDRIVVATTDNTDKNYFFSIEERLSIINHSLFKDLKLSKKKIKVISFDNLTDGSSANSP